jgi:UDP-N-acetylglucosamine acyltransferase
MQVNSHSTAIIHPSAKIGKNVTIGPYVIIEEDVSIGDDTVVLSRAHIGRGTTLGRNNRIHMGAVIGHDAQCRDANKAAGAKSQVHIGDRNVFREYVTVHRGLESGLTTVIGNDNLFMAFSHVAHDCCIGNHVTMANGVLLAGHVEVEDFAFLSGASVVHQFCRIGRYAMVGGNAGISKDVPPYMLVDNNQDLIGSMNLVGLRRGNFSEDAKRDIKNAYKILYLSGLSVPSALEQILAGCHSEEVHTLVHFIKHSKRGILPHRTQKKRFENEARVLVS